MYYFYGNETDYEWSRLELRGGAAVLPKVPQSRPRALPRAAERVPRHRRPVLSVRSYDHTNEHPYPIPMDAMRELGLPILDETNGGDEFVGYGYAPGTVDRGSRPRRSLRGRGDRARRGEARDGGVGDRDRAGAAQAEERGRGAITRQGPREGDARDRVI